MRELTLLQLVEGKQRDRGRGRDGDHLDEGVDITVALLVRDVVSALHTFRVGSSHETEGGARGEVGNL